MRILNCLKLLVASFIVVSCQQAPLEIYVSTNGNDGAAGDQAHPVNTLERANNLASNEAGKRAINIFVEDGVYYLPQTLVLNAQNSGSNNYPVVFKAVNEGKAVISGGQKLNLSWKPYRKGIFQANITDDVIIDQLYVNGKRQRMARFPNAVEGKNVFDSWDLIHTHQPDPGNDPLAEKRVASWKNPEGAFVHAMHISLWGDMHWLVKGKDESGKLIMEGGWQNNRPSRMHPRYRMVENVFEELDVPGEWYYNKGERKLFYYPHEGEDLNTAKIEIVRLKHLVEFNGSKEAPVKNITFDGFTFRHAARSFMENKEQLLRSDWTTYRGGAVVFNGAEDCTVLNCEFDQVGGNSIFVNNYNRKIAVRGCYIHHSGANGVAFVGDPNTVRSPIFRYGPQDFKAMDRTPGPKGDNYPTDCIVEDCLITMTGRDEKQTSPVQISMSYKIKVSHCSIYDVPRAGINISEGTFGGHTIEYCDVFNTVLETGDHGSFNSWGRDRFWTPDIRVTDVEVKKVPDLPKYDMLAPNTICYSRWRCDHGWDIDLDDGSTWYNIYNNVLLNGGLKMREGYFRTASNNVIINNSFHPHVWYPNSGDRFKNNIVYGAYRPAAMNRALAVDDKWGEVLDSNLFATSEVDRMKFAINGCDAHSLVGNPMFTNTNEGNYAVKENSPAVKMGFKNFPMDQFGVVSEKLRKIAKQPEIPVIASANGVAAGKIHQWYGAKVKNIETLGEQSAAGLSSISGVALLEVTKKSALADKGFQTGDVVLKVNGTDVKNFAQLQMLVKKNKDLGALKITVMHNQKLKEIKCSLK
ncbi:PDZ domain-containing protein [Puteibacter caeruleilacunae]|nr:PDZ domain-containing protein [Puteibacter caeruleilacunae]